MVSFLTTFTTVYNYLLEQDNEPDVLSKTANFVKDGLSKIPESEKIKQLFNTPIPEAGVSWNDIAMVDSWLDWKSILYVGVSIFDPTGVLSWPYLDKALSNYKQDSSNTNAFFLLLAIISIIPVAGKPFRLLFKILKLGIIIKFFPVFFILWMMRKSNIILGRVGNVDKILADVSQKFSKVTLKSGENLGELFRETIKKTHNKDIPEIAKLTSGSTGKTAGKTSLVSKVVDKAAPVVNMAAKPVISLNSLRKGMSVPASSSRLALGAGLPALASKEKTDKEKEEFLKILKDLSKLDRIPASGGSRRPEFGKIGDVRPALY